MAIRSALALGRKTNPSTFSVPAFVGARHVINTANPVYKPISDLNSRTGFRFSIRAIHEVIADAVVPKGGNGEQHPENWKIKMLYDGECPLCMREVNMLRERDQKYGAIKFVDISSNEYKPEENQGLDYETVMGRIHGILSDGTIVKDIEAFRKLYEAVGLGWVYSITKYEPVATIADAVYGVWAKYRLQITGRPPLEDVLEARRKKGEVCGDSKACKM